MIRLADFPHVPSWFVILPDCESAAPVRTALRDRRLHEISHPSGRPWLLGCWSENVLAIGEAGRTKIALIGQHAVAADRLAEAAHRVWTVADLDGLASSLVGSFHLVASVAGAVRVQGTVVGVRRVFHTSIGGAVIVSDRADVLAWLLNAGLDEQRLALHLLNPSPLHPLAGQPVWRGVAALPADHYLVLDGDRPPRSIKWWSPPEPVVPMDEGAPALREALRASIDARTRGRKLVSCDLGGLDSTSVCCLAALGEAKVVAYTAAGRDPLQEDVSWAARTIAGLGNVEHHVIPAEHIPLMYQIVEDTENRFDEPCAAVIDRERWLTIVRQAVTRGSRLHLCGIGGDELLYGSPAHLHSLLRVKPAIAWRHLRGFAAKYRWPRRNMLRQLLDKRPYGAWLDEVADDLTAPLAPREEPLLEWEYRPRLPPWATPAAVDAVREQMLASARTAEPLAKKRGQHRELEMMQFASRVTRQLAQMAAQVGVTLAAPYYDDRVIEAGLAVRPEERITPWRYKPLILEAMRGIVPDESLTRQTSDDGDCDADPGLRQHRHELLSLWEDSRLGKLGLIDDSALREVCSRPLSPLMQDNDVLRQTLACEVWLRSLESVTVAR
jgi:asparagine synthase (glutamine-hydrolysing)